MRLGGRTSASKGWFVLFCYIHFPLVASDGVYILDNNPPVFCSAENTELMLCSNLGVVLFIPLLELTILTITP